MKSYLTEKNVHNMVLNWYHGTNEHVPSEYLECMLAENVRMTYPNISEPILGLNGFREWYKDVLQKYFDETHIVENWDIKLNGETAEALVIVRWETRSWQPGHAKSKYEAFLSQQRFVIARSSDSGQMYITEKHVITFVKTASAYGPGDPLPRADIQNSMVALVSANPLATEAFYAKYFGFKRARVYLPGENQVTILRNTNTYIQIFPAFMPRPPCLDLVSTQSPYPGGGGAGPLYPGVRKLAFLVGDVEQKLEEMGDAANITQSLRPGLIPGSKVVWIADPSGNIIELIEGYYDDTNPPPPPENIGLEIPIWNKAVDIAYAVNLARSGETENLKKWLDAGGNPNQYDKLGWTPLLAAAVRGHSSAVEALLNGPWYKADMDMPHEPSGALPIHFAGHSGNVKTAELILQAKPDHLDQVWELNGHTLFLQAVFYGHTELARFALAKGTDTAITTVRGLGGMELAKQFQNEEMKNVIKPYEKLANAKQAYIEALLRKIAPVTPFEQIEIQKLSDRLGSMIENGINTVATKKDTDFTSIMKEIKEFVSTNKLDINRLCGPLQQPPLIITVTGNNGDPANQTVARFRLELAEYLLSCAADPTIEEKHPMGVNAIIRAAVFNHLDILKAMATRISQHRLTAALNEQPIVNGMTALHDTVLRSATAGSERLIGYLDQIRWLRNNGASYNIEDYSGITPKVIAERITDMERRAAVLTALGS
jgi:glyoxylase I family protein